jgi:hypothetical protein
VREGLSPLKDVVWDGNCRLHTGSITRYNLGSTLTRFSSVERSADTLRDRRLTGLPITLRCRRGGTVRFIGRFDSTWELRCPLAIVAAPRQMSESRSYVS